jgi:hypothetical protein
MPVLFPDLLAEIAFESDPAAGYLKLDFSMVASGDSYLYYDMSDQPDYTIQAGDYLEFDVWWEAPGAFVEFTMSFGDGTELNDVLPVIFDTNGYGMGTGVNLDPVAVGQWYHRKASLSSLAGSTKQMIKSWDLSCDANGGGTFSGRIRDVQITDGAGTIRRDVWRQLMTVPTLTRRRQKPDGASSSTTTAIVTEGATTVPLVSAAAFSSTGGEAVSGSYVFAYTGKSGNSLTGCTRTPAMANGATVATLSAESLAATKAAEEPIFEDVTPFLLEAHPRHGRPKQLARCEPGVCPVVLDNSDRRFDPENSGELANLITNPSFELGTTGWDAAASWFNNVGATLGLTPISPVTGRQAAIITTDAVSNVEGVRFVSIPVVAGQTYIFSLYVWSNSGSVALEIGLGASSVGSSTFAFNAVAGAWKRVSVVLVATATGTAQAAIHGTTAAVRNFQIDAAMVEQVGDNLVVNPGFEVDLSSWALSNGAGVTWTRDTVTKRSGAASTKLVNTAAGGNDFISQAFAGAVPGRAYVATVWVNCTAFTAGAAANRGAILTAIHGVTGAEVVIGQEFVLTGTTGGWVKVTLRGIVPKDYNAVRLRLYSPQATVYFDDAAVYLDEEPSILPSDYADGDQDNCRWSGAEHASTSYRGGPYYPNVVAGREMRIRIPHYYERLKADGAASIWRLNDDLPGSLASWAKDWAGNVLAETSGVGSSTPADLQGALLFGDNEETTFRFDGGDYLQFGDAYRFKGNEPFSVSAYIYPEAASIAADGNRKYIVGTVHAGAGQRQGWNLVILNKRIRLERWLNGVVQFVEYAADLVADTIYHMTATYDGANLKIYVNGGLQGTVASSQALLDEAAVGRIGINAFTGVDAFTGRLSSIAVWTFPLTAEQVRAHNDKAAFAFVGDQFDGFVHDWPVDWRARLSEVAITLDDGFEQLSQADISGFRGIEYSGPRIAWALDQGGYSGERALDPGRSLVEESSSLSGTLLDNDPALDHILVIAETELGLFFFDGAGRAVFHDRLRRLLSQGFIQGTFTNDPVHAGAANALLAVDIVPSKSIEDVLNDVRLRPVAAETDGVAIDYSSQLKYRIRSLSNTIWLTSVPECQSQAEWVISQFRESALRFDELKIDPKRDLVGLVPQILQLEVSERIAVMYRPSSGMPGALDLSSPVVTKECYVEGIEHDIVTRDGRWSWETRYALSAAETQAYWVLGDAANSLLGVSTVLGY